MIALLPIIEQLEAAGLKRIEGIVEYAALEAPPQMPAYFVVPEEETAAVNTLSGVIDQKITVRFRVVVLVKGSARRAELPSEDVKRETEAVRDALVGWRHPECNRDTEYEGARLLFADRRAIAWAVRFRSSYHFRKP